MNLKSIYLIAILLSLTIGLKAQDKYEQAIVIQGTFGLSHSLLVSIEGQEFKKIKVNNDEVSDRFNDYSALLKQLASLRNDGWEVWNAAANGPDTGQSGIVYFLRRKLK